MEANIPKGRLSDRGMSNVTTVIPRIPKTIPEAGNTHNEEEIVDMSVAENWLIRDEILKIEKEVVEKKLKPESAANDKNTADAVPARDFWGDPTLLKALAGFFNEYFEPGTPVLPSHIAVAPGAAGCVDALLYNICDPGDGVLLPAPYWNGYDTFCHLRASTVPVLVPVTNLDDEASFLPALQETFEKSSCPIKVLMLANPHNPLGRCFSKEVLKACLRFCQEKDIHFVSDEVFGPLTFECPDLPSARPFVSVLSINSLALGCDPSRVHVIWSPSKVFALSGMLASTQLPDIMKANADRFTESYKVVTSFLKRMNLPYIPCNAGPFILAQLAPHAQSWDDEATMIKKLKDVGVWVSAGRSHHMPEDAKGWARIMFALEPETIERGLVRMEKALKP